VPEGFVVERVAGPPEVERPIMASFDDRGRLYVSDSAGVNLKGSELLKNPPHKIRLLEDPEGTGRFTKSQVFADKLVFPQGLLWHQGAVYTTSPPSFWKLEDTQGVGICDKRTELVTGLANTGVADDAHGACLGPDGRIYFLPGRMSHNLRYPDGTPIRKAVGPWLMRIRTDGKDAEIVSGCQGNPVEVDWLPEGDFFISGTFWAPDSFGGGLRDALIHGVEGGEYPVRDRLYNDRKRTGDFLPVLYPMVATAPAGMMIYRSAAFGPEYTNNLFCAYFNTHKVMRHILERDGATWRSKNEDFVVSTSVDFHPTDVLEDADGSLLVVDTGGWFRIGCPTSQIAKPDVLGGIWRIRRKDAPRPEDPRGLKIHWASATAGELVRLLDDDRFVVRERATEALAAMGAPALAEAVRSPSVRIRRNALWALSRVDGPEARALSRPALADKEAGIRQVAAISAGLHRDSEAMGALERLVTEDAPQIRREAAGALGRIGDRRAVPALLASLKAGGDRFLEHAVLYALIRIKDREGMIQALHDPASVVRRGALIALDQMDGGEVTKDLVTPLLDPTDPALHEAALRVILGRPAWSKEILGLAWGWLSDPHLEEGRRENLRGILIAFAKDPDFQDLVARTLRNGDLAPATRVLLLEAMTRAPLEKLPSTWLAEARWSLDHPDPGVVRQAMATLRSAGSTECDEALLRLAKDESKSAELRAEALQGAAPRIGSLEKGLLKFLAGCLSPDQPPLLRVTAADALGRAALDDKGLEVLLGLIPKAGPLELPRLLPAFERTKNPALGRKLLVALKTSPGLESLSGEALRRVIRGFPPEVREEASALQKRLEADTERMKAKLDEMEPVLKGGDAARGREIFFGRKAGCTACHTILGQGAKVGPDLSKIGQIRSGRDLLEAIVFPSASFARGYEPFALKTKDGAVYDGLILRETPEAIYMFTASERLEKRIPKTSIEAIKEGKVSVMPQGLDQQITRQDLGDLIAFLQALK
jgi:putative heme-binding domain-containing protein